MPGLNDFRAAQTSCYHQRSKMYGRAVAYKGSLLPEDAGDRDINVVGVRDVTRVWY